MFRLWIENERNQKLELSNSPYFEDVEIDGLLPGKASISTTTIANTDGVIINNARSESRPITIDIIPATPVEENRQRIYTYFKKKKYVTIRFKNKNRDLKIKGMVENIEGNLFSQKQVISIDVLCENPYFEEEAQTYVNMAQVLDLFEFPFSIDKEGVEFSRIEKTIEQNVINKGDTETGMVIELTASGTVVNPIIYNVDTRDSFGLNITMQFGDLIRINTNAFNKKVELVRYGETKNIINHIIKGNKWFKVQPGDNLFTYDCNSGGEFLSVKFIFSNLFEGV